jgi:hypothetical protein
MYLDTHQKKNKTKNKNKKWEGGPKGKIKHSQITGPQTTVILPLDLEGCFHESYFRLLCSLTNVKISIYSRIDIAIETGKGGSHTKRITMKKKTMPLKGIPALT